jgi:stress-induced morphogen
MKKYIAQVDYMHNCLIQGDVHLLKPPNRLDFQHTDGFASYIVFVLVHFCHGLKAQTVLTSLRNSLLSHGKNEPGQKQYMRQDQYVNFGMRGKRGEDFMSPEQIKQRLQETYPEAYVDVTDLTGTEDHYSVYIASQVFKGMSRIQRHKHVMAAFAEELKTGEVHALTIRTDEK